MEAAHALTPQAVLRKLVSGARLSVEEAAQNMEGVMEGEWTPAQIGAYLAALAVRGESAAEVEGSARTMREKAASVATQVGPLLDIVGSGGDGQSTLNVSTLAALVAASAGAQVAKHGNRAVTSSCGSADLIEDLGIDLECTPLESVQRLEQTGFTFLFAPQFHPAMRHAAAPRRETGFASLFNLLGPLTNPLGAVYYVLGVHRRERMELFAQALSGLGCQRALVVHGAGGLDELSLSGPSWVVELHGGEQRTYTIHPRSLQLQEAPLEALRVADRQEALRAAQAVLRGEGSLAHRHLVALNAGAGLYVAERAPSLAEGVAQALHALESGRTQALWERLKSWKSTAWKSTAAK